MKRPFFFLVLAVLLSGCGPQQEEQYLSFLYRYMPLPDSVDYSRSFWHQNVEVSLRARREMPWGASLPEREWRHFVLPVRVNNENLDTARSYIYNVLRERVRELSMYDAVLEVNHWCHEHATYQPSDGRTQSPLVTLRSGTGRCGEESTFCVAALRAMGIPARQVYTPRWAHTDDNHAWVEAWVDGQWHFLGACEPEPVLDKGWFNQPASRGMLMHTKVFGHYDGPEEVVSSNACYTEINVTENYAPVSQLRVWVQDTDGHPVPDATVEFRLYNYAEFYPLCRKQADADGCASLTCGRGDLLVWAHAAGSFGFCQARVGQDQEVDIILSYSSNSTYSDYSANSSDSASNNYIDFTLIPPSPHDNLPPVTEAQEAANKLRLQQEDSLRRAYADTAFSSSGDKRLRAACANWRSIQRFMQEYPEQSDSVFSGLSRKDFRDVPYAVLQDFALSGQPPRIANEMLTPWFSPLRARFGGQSARDILRWVQDSLTVDDSRNPQQLCMSPLGTLRHRTCDRHSRDIFLVAALRAAGHKAFIDEVTGRVFYREDSESSENSEESENSEYSDYSEDSENSEYSDYSEYSEYSDNSEYSDTLDIPLPGTLSLKCDSPLFYYRHFTLSRVTPEGSLQLMEYPEDAGAGYFARGVSVAPGLYLLTSGQRLASGAVLARMRFFRVEAGRAVEVPLTLRHDTDEAEVIGTFDSETRYLPMGETLQRSLLSETGRGYFAVGFIAPGEEPTNHALRDLAAAREALESWGRPIVLLVPSGTDLPACLRRPEFQGLPSTVRFGTLDSSEAPRPVFLIADTFNRVVFRSRGYTIGLGQQLADLIKKIEKR